MFPRFAYTTFLRRFLKYFYILRFHCVKLIKNKATHALISAIINCISLLLLNFLICNSIFTVGATITFRREKEIFNHKKEYQYLNVQHTDSLTAAQDFKDLYAIDVIVQE